MTATPDPVHPETAQAISRTLVRVMKIMAAMKQHAPRQHAAVDPSHYPLLFCVSDEARRVSAVADTIHSDVSTVSRQVTHLVQHGLLEKIGDPDDGRAQLLSLSPAGREVIERLVEQRGQWFGQLLASWTDEEARQFERFLSRFGDDVEAVKAQLPGATPGHQAPPVASRPDADQAFLDALTTKGAARSTTTTSTTSTTTSATGTTSTPQSTTHSTTRSRTNQELSRER